jgi:predicted aconitase with swiveling domain
MSDEAKSGVMKARGAVPAAVVVETCHDILNTVATLLANLEFLTNAGTGSNAEREAASADALESIRRLTGTVRHLQDSARRGVEHAA